MLVIETHARSVVKAVTYRVIGTLATALLVFIATRQVALSLAVGVAEFISKIGIYWVHERVWARIKFGRRYFEPAVIWLTGFSGSGKSTISDAVAAELRSRGHRVEQLDGDNVREIFPSTGYGRADRDAHVRRVGYLASRLEGHGVFVVASFVSPYAESRDFIRTICQNFVEVHVATPIEECERRDEKGLYARARRGEIKEFTGINDPYEAPLRPELRFDTTTTSVADASNAVISHVLKRQVAL